jgi:hypothetical protein
LSSSASTELAHRLSFFCNLFQKAASFGSWYPIATSPEKNDSGSLAPSKYASSWLCTNRKHTWEVNSPHSEAQISQSPDEFPYCFQLVRPLILSITSNYHHGMFCTMPQTAAN